MDKFKTTGGGENPPRQKQETETWPLPPLPESETKMTREALLRKLPQEVGEHLIGMYLANIPEESSQAFTLQLQIWAKAGIEVSSEQLFAAREMADALKEELKMILGDRPARASESGEIDKLKQAIEEELPEEDASQVN